MSRLLQAAETTQKKKGYTTTTSATGQSIQDPTGEKKTSLLRTLLSGEPVDSLPPVATTAGTKKPWRNAPYARPGSSSNGVNPTTTLQTPITTSRPNSSYTPSGDYSDTNRRGEKITIHTLADYCSDNELYTQEDFMFHATQIGPNRGRELYRHLSLRDWDKKLSQAIDIAQSYTPDIPFRTRVENYKEPNQFDYWRGTCTYNEYMELFKHHGIGLGKLQRFFKTLCGDNGKINTIYMWGRADAGKTTIIKLFDAFYSKWEIGRCSAQNINSNFWLQDLYMKRLFHADEILATQVNIDTLKLLLEGSDDLTTDIKYAKKVSIRGRPVMMATNDPLWINMSTAAEPIRKRCEWVHMTRPWNKPAPFMSTKDKEILQYVQHRLWKTCFPKGYDTYITEQEYNQALDEIADDEIMNQVIDLEQQHGIQNPPINIDTFISEMN